MPIDENRWKEMMIESGQMPDDNGYYHYNPKAIEDVHKWMLEKKKIWSYRTLNCCFTQ